LVSGSRDGGGRVRQRILCYLGPLSRLSTGVPSEDKKRVAQRLGTTKVDWDKVNLQLRRIPITYEELQERRRREYNSWVKRSNGNLHRPLRTRPRAPGELEALARIARARFREVFERVSEREYRMR